MAPGLLTGSLIVFINSSTTFIAPITLGRAILEEIRLTFSARDIKDEVLVCIRVDDIDIVSDKRKKLYLNVVKAEIENSVFSGRALILKAKLNDQIIIIHTTGNRRFQHIDKEGSEILCRFNLTAII